MAASGVRRVALVLLLVGAMTMASPQLAWSSVSADRETAVSIVTDSEGYLAVTDQQDVAELRGDDTPKRVATLVNNVSETLTIADVTVASINTTSASALKVSNPPDSYDLASGGSVAVTVSCNSSVSAGQSLVTFNVTRAVGDTTEIVGVNFSVVVNIQCNKGGGGGGTGGPQFVAHDVQSNSTQRFEFNATALKNKEFARIDLSDAQGNGIDYNGSTVQVVSGPAARQLYYDEAAEEIVYQGQGNPTGTVVVEISGFTVSGSAGDSFTAYYSDDRGRSGSDGFQIA